MREWHHVNLRSNENSKTIPPNTLVTNNDDSHIIYEGSYDEVLGIANGLPGSSSVPACWLMRGHWKEIFPLLSEPSFQWAATGQEQLCLIKIGKMLKSDFSKMQSQTSSVKNPSIGETERKLQESSKRNPYLPLPPPPLMPHPDEIGVKEKEEDKEGNEKVIDKKESEKEKKGVCEEYDHKEEGDFDQGEDYNEEEEFVDGNISDWLEY